MVEKKVIIVTKETQMEQLVKKFSSREQAQFYLKQSKRAFKMKSSNEVTAATMASIREEDELVNADFQEMERADSQYKDSIRQLHDMMPRDVKVQHIDWTFLPNFLFGERDIVIALGQDGLVINTAKYLEGQPIVAVNPDPDRFDGILLPFDMRTIKEYISAILNDEYIVSDISIARASMDNGQECFGVNDIFIGPKSHTSFRYSISFMGTEEDQSSSGIIVSTGCGSTGWFKSVITGARSISSSFDENEPVSENPRFPWDSDYLYFSVREPFLSKTSSTSMTFGQIDSGNPLVITSHMAENGIIFSDGIEKDFLEFNSGRIVTITLADRKARLVTQ